jgi:hypothetical protein
MPTRKSKRPRVQLGIVKGAFSRPNLYAWTCPWCGDAYASFTRDLVSSWAIRHLNQHMRRQIVHVHEED